MDIKHVVRITAAVAVCTMLGTAIGAEYLTGADRRLWGLTLTTFALAFQVVVVMLAMWRLRTLRDLYTMGYRHGRHDANKSLLDAGLWLSESAERDANRNIGE